MARTRHNDPLTKEQTADYLIDSGRCPRCGCRDIVGGVCRWHPRTCITCRLSWSEIRELEIIVQIKKEGEPQWL